MGRPPVRPAKLTEGFYIEVKNIGSKDKGIKIRSNTKVDMERIAKDYARNKDVVILGEFKNENWVVES